MRIVFMGTPDFAVPCLEILLKSQYDVAAVVTAADKPAGRGQQIVESAVKKCALKHGLKILQPEKLKSETFIEELKNLQADLFVIVAFRMLPEIVWNMPKKGSINLHASLLPQYRGAAPLNWAIINGEKETGISTFFLKHEIDTGSIIYQSKIPVTDTMTVGELHDTAMHLGAELILKTVNDIRDNKVQEIPQSEVMQKLGLEENNLKHAPKIFKPDMLINWTKNAQEVFNLIRGLSPYPSAFTQLNGLNLKIYKSEILEKSNTLSPGEYLTDGKSYLAFKCSDKLINVLELQLEGKKKMNVEDFLRGYKLDPRTL
jgi:methionyl-tRNA formyltransferase